MSLDPAIATPVRLDESLQPMLAVVVDTEEEFDWSAPFSRKARATLNMREQHRAQAVLDRHGVAPLYVIDHPVARDDAAVGWLRETVQDGRCEVGAHLHSWVTPPYDEPVCARNSYGCNLDPGLERAKISALTEAVTQALGTPPAHFRTGRYGAGEATLKTIQALGYRCDLSVAPHSSFRRDGGPEFYGWTNTPQMMGDLAILPVTTGFSGVASGLGPRLAPLLDAPAARRLRVPGLLAGLGLMDRARLTVEGVPVDALKRLMASLIGSGERLLTLSYHSSTLLPGATVYARTESERDALVESLDETLAHFTRVLGGRLVSVSEAETTVRSQENRRFAKP